MTTKGYEQLVTGRIVLAEDAKEFALLQLYDDIEFYNDVANSLVRDELIPLKQKDYVVAWANASEENKSDIADWYFSGNWIRVELDEDGRVISNE